MLLKRETQEGSLDAVDLFGDDELEKFFAKRYRQTHQIQLTKPIARLVIKDLNTV